MSLLLPTEKQRTNLYQKSLGVCYSLRHARHHITISNVFLCGCDHRDIRRCFCCYWSKICTHGLPCGRLVRKLVNGIDVGLHCLFAHENVLQLPCRCSYETYAPEHHRLIAALAPHMNCQFVAYIYNIAIHCCSKYIEFPNNGYDWDWLFTKSLVPTITCLPRYVHRNSHDLSTVLLPL